VDPGEYAQVLRWIKNPPNDDKEPVHAFEDSVTSILGLPGVAAVNSGRQALRLILEYFKIGAGDEMIVPAYTLNEMLTDVQAMGITLVPADLDTDTFNITTRSVAQRITSKTKAILALHIFGAPCDIEGLRELATRRGLYLIEDCAHALGSTVFGRSTGFWGDAAFFSLETTKTVNTYGGGLVVSHDPELLKQAREFNLSQPEGNQSLLKKMKAVRSEQRMFRYRLAYPPLFMLASPRLQPLMNRLYRGSQKKRKGQERYSAVQARLGLNKLHSLAERLTLRYQRAGLLNSLLIRDIHPQRILAGTESTNYFYVVCLPCPAAPIRRQLLYQGIDAGVGNEIMDNCARQLGYEDCTNTDTILERAIALPMFDGIKEKACEQVAKTLNQLVSRIQDRSGR